MIFKHPTGLFIASNAMAVEKPIRIEKSRNTGVSAALSALVLGAVRSLLGSHFLQGKGKTF
jgi:hypothetical protein